MYEGGHTLEREVIVALDFPTFEDTLSFLEQFRGEDLFVKVGMELYLQNGPVILQQIQAFGCKVFLDLKLHDIPNTVYSVTKGLAQFGVEMLTVHAAGGVDMLRAAKKGMLDGGSAHTKVIAITQLTSTSEANMQKEQLIEKPLHESVLHYAQLAKEAGLDGVVSSVYEVADILEVCGNDFVTVTPGIRCATDEVGDQKRVATPQQAYEQGASYIVVGRPITKSTNPLQAYKQMVNRFKEA